MSKFNNIPLVMGTLNATITKNVHGIILHSAKVSNTHFVMNTKPFLNLKPPTDYSPMENFQGILKKETLYNNDIKTIEEYQTLLEDRIVFYNTKRLKNRKKYKISF